MPRFLHGSPYLICLTGLFTAGFVSQGFADRAGNYEKEIQPILQEHCFDCHADGEAEGSVTFDKFASTADLISQTKLWEHVLKNVRSGLMPPAKKSRIPEADAAKLVTWIKQTALQLDPLNPDPGRVTLRRLNRVEYRNTIRDLMGIDFRADEEFPADDTGYGFDNIGDVLTTSPLLLEKYMQAAETIVARAVPLQENVIPEKSVDHDRFHGPGDEKKSRNEIALPVYEPADLLAEFQITKPGTYRISLDASVVGSFPFDPSKAEATWMVGGDTVWTQEVKWSAEKKIVAVSERKWEPGRYEMRLKMNPAQGWDQRPPEIPGEGRPFVDLRLRGAVVLGPLEPEHATRPPNYSRFFSREVTPTEPAEKQAYAAEILRRFTTRAFRRPVDEATVARLTGLAEETMAQPDGSFQKGIARAITAVLASPRFLFRMEAPLPSADPATHPLLDEYALASRLSYFLWSTMPDEELYQLAEQRRLRQELKAQVHRLLQNDQSKQFVRNFAGQWLQTRDVESVSIDARIVQARDIGTDKELRSRFERRQKINLEIDEAEKAHDEPKLAQLRGELAEMRRKFTNMRRVDFSTDLRSAMRQEAELLFQHLLRHDGSTLDLIYNNKTFLNEELAKHYGIPNITGDQMQLVDLPPDSPRGGLLTMGTVLAVTSNPTRTSPVKRGLFILENILGTPPPPAPPDIPSLEASEKTADGSELSMREALEVHRNQPLCASCHNRMDPLGFALENFNAIGLWRDTERGERLPPSSGQLITGEAFANVSELKRIIVTQRRLDYYRCLTEKLLTYAIGRGPEPVDVLTHDHITAALEASGGKFSTLIMGIIESPPFQKTQRPQP